MVPEDGGSGYRQPLSWEVPLSTPPTASNAQTVGRNVFWYGLELSFGIVGAFIVSVIVARAVGPVRLGPFNYIMWLTNITTAVGSFGLPITTRKYMAEHLNRGEAGVSHAIYRLSLRIQTCVSAAILLLAIGLIYAVGDPGYRLISVLLALNMAPRMIGFIPSQANNAAEMMRWNTTPSLIGGALNIVLTLFSIWAGWDLIGVACSVTAGAVVETILKLRAVERWLGPSPVDPISPPLKRRLLSYSGQGVVLMLLNIVVWDRSDLFLLRYIDSDVRQIAFFTLAFNLTDRMLKLPEAFGQALSVTMMAQYGRGRDALPRLTELGAKYAFLLATPLLIGIGCLSLPVVAALYGPQYRPLVPVLTVAAFLAIPRGLMTPATALLQATEKQGYLIWTGCVCGALDIGLDVLLIPKHGAFGAILANGIAQTAAVLALWVRVHRVHPMGGLFRSLARIAFTGAAMAAIVVWLARTIPGIPGIAASVVAGGVVWFVLLRLTGALDRTDRERFRSAVKSCPRPLRPVADRVIALIA